KNKLQRGLYAQYAEKVLHVINALSVGYDSPASVRTNDTWLTSKVRTALINTKEVPSLTINVTTERGIVYLMGRVTDAEGTRAGIAASGVSGVNKVVKLFEIVSPQSVQQSSSGGQQAAPVEARDSTLNNTGAAIDTGGAQAMPVQ